MELTKKQLRTLQLSINNLFSEKSLFHPKSISEINPKEYFSRELCLSGNRIILLTDSGLVNFRSVIEIINEANVFNGLADLTDVSIAWRRIVQAWLSDGVVPESAGDVIQEITKNLDQEIDVRTFVVPIYGVDLDGVESFDIGPMKLFRTPFEALDSSPVLYDPQDVANISGLSKTHLWLKGTAHGTSRVAQNKFSQNAALIVGSLAIAAGAMYAFGGIGFRIGVVMEDKDSAGRAIWFSWGKNDSGLVTQIRSGQGQRLPVNKLLSSESDMVRLIHRAIEISQKECTTELEEAIARAVYWYSDAHRDPVMVMRFIKYWSCVEVFFSLTKEEITKSVSIGLAKILVFGGFQFVPPSDYTELKKRISQLYDVRSLAVHRGHHKHVTELDLAWFSQRVAWMIINMVKLVEDGYKTLQEVKIQIDRLDFPEK